MPKHDLPYYLRSLREKTIGLRYMLEEFDNSHDFVLLWFGLRKRVTLTCRKRSRNLRSVRIDTETGRIMLIYKGRKLLFDFSSRRQLGNTMRNIYQNFIQEQYADMDIKNRKVVDIGANNGDSAMYFVINGASKVYAYEPYPSAFEEAERNIRLNRMQDRIELINEAVGKKRGAITLDTGYESVSNSMLEKASRGKRVRVVTLEGIIRRHGLRDAALKIDCEGSEYDIFSSTSDASFRRFGNIAMEYHFGYESLEKRLRSIGFKARHTRPKVSSNAETDGLRMVYGMIYARR